MIKVADGIVIKITSRISEVAGSRARDALIASKGL